MYFKRNKRTNSSKHINKATKRQIQEASELKQCLNLSFVDDDDTTSTDNVFYHSRLHSDD